MSDKKSILLVEDEILLAMSEKKDLEGYGYDVQTVNSGERAIEKVNSKYKIDLILMDINLGDGIDGTQAAKIILQDHNVPILFVSSHCEREIVERTENITSYGYVVKSSSITVLDASIKMAFKLFNSKQSILESEKRYSLSFSAVNDGLWDWDVTSGNAYFSSEYYSLLGYENREFLARYDICRTFIHPED
jgi:CheY-like chemotaxis protein